MSKIIIISGKQGEGKTSYCAQLAEQFHEQGLEVGGFIAPGKWKEEQRFSFDLFDLVSQDIMPFASREKQEGWEKIHSFYFNPEAIKKGEDLLKIHSLYCNWVFIDEIGKFEMQGRIWGPILKELLAKNINLVISARDIFVDEVIAHFNIKNYQIIDQLHS